MTALPVIGVLTSVPVEGAVFTTYTLSLAWFETYLLRGLERAGARQILLLADPLGIRSSLGEGLVTGPGVRYAVEPIEAPHGAFHAKVGVLWSASSLVIAVGSGNLTYSGMHRNLECWEVLAAGVPAAAERALSRPVAESARAFMMWLAGRVDRGSRAAATLTAAVAAIESWLPRLPPLSGGVQWLDTTRERIGDQLVQQLGARPGRVLRVLSPFHDPDGASVRRLAQGLGAAVEVLYTNRTTTCPLVDAGVTARRLTGVDGERPLHAKIFQVVDDEAAHVVSGSANATSKALWTTGNTEVSLLRPSSCAELLASEPGRPTFETTDMVEPSAQPLTILWARAGGDHVRARVRWADDSRPTEMQVGFVDSPEVPRPVTWPADDVIRTPLPAAFNPMRPRAQRVEVVAWHEGVRWAARAWVAFDELLDSSPSYRAALNAWHRLHHGEGAVDGDEDDAVLLREFAEEHVHTMVALGEVTPHFEHAGGSPPPGARASKDLSVPLRLIYAMAQSSPHALGRVGGGDTDLVGDAERAMRSAFATLDDGDDLDDDDVADPSPVGAQPRGASGASRLHRSTRQALEHFESTFVEACNSIDRAPASPGAVLAYASLCMRLALRYRLKDVAEREAFWQSVERLIRVLLCPLSRRAPLVSLLQARGAVAPGDWTEQLALLIALLCWRHDGGRLEGEVHGSPPQLSKAILREALAVLDRVADGASSPGLMPRSLARVIPAAASVMVDTLTALRGMSSPSDRALAVKARLLAIHAREVTPAASGPDRELERDAVRVLPCFVDPWVDVCPGCRQRLAAAVGGRLLRRQHDRCLNARCSRWLIPSEGT